MKMEQTECPETSAYKRYLPVYEDGTECSETSAYKRYLPVYEDGTDRVFRNVGV